MNDPLEQRIGQARARSAPACPPDLEARVLRRVRQRMAAADPADNLLAWLGSLVPRTAFALSAVAAVLVVSVLATGWTAQVMTKDRKHEVSRALGFDTILVTAVIELERGAEP